MGDFECPYCEHLYEDAWEYFYDCSDETLEVDCDSCGKTFLLSQEVIVDYTTTPTPDRGTVEVSQ